MDQYITVEAAATSTGVSARTIRFWIANGKLPATAEKRGKLVRLADVTTLAEVTGRTISPEQNQNDPAIATAVATAGSAAVVPSPDAQALEMIRDEWLRPLIAEIGDLREELGKVKAERDAAVERLSARDDGSSRHETNTAAAGVQREPAASWRVRLRRWMGWG